MDGLFDITLEMKISSSFIGSFNLGDNLVHNFDILNYLYGLYSIERSCNRKLLRKPLCILIGSICEALLDDFFFKVKYFTREGVGNLSEEVLEEVRRKKLDKFHFFIDQAKKHDFFEKQEINLYDSLHYVRQLRNRVHIQDNSKDLPIKEKECFTSEDLDKCEKVLEAILKIMDHKYSRWEGSFVDEFEYPWTCHWSTKDLIN